MLSLFFWRKKMKKIITIFAILSLAGCATGQSQVNVLNGTCPAELDLENIQKEAE